MYSRAGWIHLQWNSAQGFTYKTSSTNVIIAWLNCTLPWEIILGIKMSNFLLLNVKRVICAFVLTFLLNKWIQMNNVGETLYFLFMNVIFLSFTLMASEKQLHLLNNILHDQYSRGYKHICLVSPHKTLIIWFQI